MVPRLAAELTMAARGGGSNPLLGHFPTVELCARSLYTVDPIDNALHAREAQRAIGRVVTSFSGPAGAPPVMSTIDVLTPNKEKMNE
ncbi:MAG: hypothetical protein WB757_02415 [Candidatus Cybelea sp.]